MSRSNRRTPVTGITTAPSEKRDKQLAHRRLRTFNRAQLTADHDDTALMDDRIAGNPWSAAKDGKRWWSRQDIAEMPELMRK